MISRSQRLRLGIFLVASLGILLGLLVTVVGSSLFADRDRYTVRYDISVSGLEVGAPVKYNGVRVGRVESIAIDPLLVSQTVVTLSLQSGTPVKRNARAVLSVQGITGLKFIELVGGTSEAETLPVGGEIPAGSSIVDKLTGQAEAIAIKGEILVNQLLALTDDANRALVADVLERAGSLMNNTDEALKRNAAAIDKTAEGLAVASARLGPLLEEARLLVRDTRETVAALRKAALAVLDEKRLGVLVEQAQATVGELRQRVGPGGLGKITTLLEQLLQRSNSLAERLDMLVSSAREDLRASIRYLAETAENMRDFSRIIREDPSLLLRQRERRERVLP